MGPHKHLETQHIFLWNVIRKRNMLTRWKNKIFYPLTTFLTTLRNKQIQTFEYSPSSLNKQRLLNSLTGNMCYKNILNTIKMNEEQKIILFKDIQEHFRIIMKTIEGNQHPEEFGFIMGNPCCTTYRISCHNCFFVCMTGICLFFDTRNVRK